MPREDTSTEVVVTEEARRPVLYDARGLPLIRSVGFKSEQDKEHKNV